MCLHGLWPQPRSRAYCGVSERHVELDVEQVVLATAVEAARTADRDPIAGEADGGTEPIEGHFGVPVALGKGSAL